MRRRRKVLVVDDEPTICSLVAELLEPEHAVSTACSVDEAITVLTDDVFDVLLADIRMPGRSGIELVQHALEHHPETAVMVMSGRGTIEEFIELLRLGVCDGLLKPFDGAELSRAVERAVAIGTMRAENERLKSRLELRADFSELVGDGTAMTRVKEAVQRVAPTDATVLITGESGTGKELVARAIHAASHRARAPLVAVNCGALPPQLLESELFGHVRGAFTGAERSRSGRFEEAEGGTLLLDEVGTMTEAAQVRLLRVLGERELTRVGDDQVRPIDVRIVAATNADLQELVEQGRFREDLYYRLDVFPIRLPDLVERKEDIPRLAEHLLRRACDRIGRAPKRLAPEALRRLRRHDWPGNVRELENTIERAVILAGDHDEVAPEDVLLGQGSSDGGPWTLPEDGLDLPVLLEGIEDDLIDRALERTGHNKQQAARLLGLQRTTLVQKLRRREHRVGH